MSYDVSKYDKGTFYYSTGIFLTLRDYTLFYPFEKITSIKFDYRISINNENLSIGTVNLRNLYDEMRFKLMEYYDNKSKTQDRIIEHLDWIEQNTRK